MNNICIGLGQAGSNVVRMISNTASLMDVELFAIDSILNSIKLESVGSIKYIPIISDEKSGFQGDHLDSKPALVSAALFPRQA